MQFCRAPSLIQGCFPFWAEGASSPSCPGPPLFNKGSPDFYLTITFSRRAIHYHLKALRTHTGPARPSQSFTRRSLVSHRTPPRYFTTVNQQLACLPAGSRTLHLFPVSTFRFLQRSRHPNIPRGHPAKPIARPAHLSTPNTLAQAFASFPFGFQSFCIHHTPSIPPTSRCLVVRVAP